LYINLQVLLHVLTTVVERY